MEAAAQVSLLVTPRDHRVCCRVVRLELDRIDEQRQGLFGILRHRCEGKRQRAEIKVIGVQAVRPLPPRALDLCFAQGRLDDTYNADRQLVLDGEDIVERAVVMVGPDVGAGSGVDQLSRDANAVPGFPDAAFEGVAHAQLAADLLQVHRLAPVGEARVAGDYEDPFDPGQPGDDVFDHAVGEVVLLWIAAEIGERQHRDRRLVWEGQAGPGRPRYRNRAGAGDGVPVGIRQLANQRPQVPLTRDALELLQASIAELEA